MTVTPIENGARQRGISMLRTAMGPEIARHLADPTVVEVMLNPDGRLWIDCLTDGMADTGERIVPADAERIVRLVAHHVGAEVAKTGDRVVLIEDTRELQCTAPNLIALRTRERVITLSESVQDHTL